MIQVPRRQFLYSAVVASAGCASPAGFSAAASGRKLTKGVVLMPFDLTLADWPDRAHRAGLNTIGLHAVERFDALRAFVAGADGRAF